MGQVPQADSADSEFAVDRARPTAQLAATNHAAGEFRPAFRLCNLRLGRHNLGFLLVRTKRHAQQTQQLPGFLIRLGRRLHGDIHSQRRGHLRRIDLREDRLLIQTHIVVATTVEARRIQTSKVTHPRNCQ